MATWKNLDTLDSFGKLKELKNHVDIAAALSGEEGGKRVADYSTPMAAGHFLQLCSQRSRRNRFIRTCETG